MKCVECKCLRTVKQQRYNKATNKVVLVTVQKCFGVSEPFEISDIYQECVAYPKEHWKDRENTVTPNRETVVLPVSIGDIYYTKSLIFYDGIDAAGEPASDIQFNVRKRLIKNKSDIYQYMMLHERGQAFLTEKEAEQIQINLNTDN